MLDGSRPAYKAGKVYNVVEDYLAFYRDNYSHDLHLDDCGFVIENDMGSKCYFSRRTMWDKGEFDRKWKREE